VDESVPNGDLKTCDGANGAVCAAKMGGPASPETPRGGIDFPQERA